MKRFGNLYDRIISLENLRMADIIARKGKKHQKGVIRHLQNEEGNIIALHQLLKAGGYRTSPYRTFSVYEPKERLVYELPYYPDRIVHHAIMNVLEPIFMAHFTADTYSCIKGRGIHGALNNLKRALRDESGTRYCLKLDIRKFYPSIDDRILKLLIRRKIKDERLLVMLDEIIDSAEGLPIGNYLSQYLANFYLSGLDHFIKEVLRVKYYLRYADDIVILAGDKDFLHALLAQIRTYLSAKLKLEVKGNYQVFPVAARGIDFAGYVQYHTHTRLRKSIKKNFARAMSTKPSLATAASYYGWACHADCNHLLKKLLSNEKVFRIQHRPGERILHWRQNQDRAIVEHTHSSGEFSNKGFEVQRKLSLASNKEG